MRLATLGFVTGAAWLQTQADLPGQTLMLGCAATAAFLLFALRGALRAACAGALLGFAWAALCAQLALAPQLAKDDEGRDVTLVGTIDSLPYRFEQGVRFNLAVVLPVMAAMPTRATCFQGRPVLKNSWRSSVKGMPGRATARASWSGSARKRGMLPDVNDVILGAAGSTWTLAYPTR